MRPVFRALCLLLVVPLLSCSRVWQARFVTPQRQVELDTQAPFLKCHLKSGEVYVLQNWKVDDAARTVSGNGLLYDAERVSSTPGTFTVPFDQVALFETNRPESLVHANVAIMGVLTGVSLVATAACLTQSKACFGSCPTFFATDGQKPVLEAEGFSHAVARTLEDTDVDSLYDARPADGRLDLTMRNDALETHAVNGLRVLAAPRPPGGRVFYTRSGFLATSAPVPPKACAAPNGDCLAPVSHADEVEYWSPADDKDLATKERVELSFPAGQGRRGLVIGARNSLLNTYLFYQMLAYAGRSAGDWIMRLERGGAAAKEGFSGVGALLGDIQVFARTEKRGWVPAGKFAEVGPIAREVQIVELPPDLPPGDVQVRLELTKGNWRLDFVALAGITGDVKPVAIPPSRAEHEGKDAPEVLARLNTPKEHLFTYPGDVYTFHFDLPAGDQELFLESRGYYYEWVREQWLPEEDQTKVAEAAVAPEELLRKLAPSFKRIEPDMERVFWQSRYGR